MSRHEGGNDVHRVILVELLKHLQHFYLCFQINAVAALGLTGSYAQAHHLVEEAFCLIVKFLKRCLSGLPYGVHNATACSEDIKIARSLQLERDFILSVAAENHVCMSFYKSRCYQVALRIDN